jgi:hypothetical protein
MELVVTEVQRGVDGPERLKVDVDLRGIGDKGIAQRD